MTVEVNKAKKLVKDFRKASKADRQKLVKSRQSEFVELAKNHSSAKRKGLDKTIEVILNDDKNGVVAKLNDGTTSSFKLETCLDVKPDLKKDIYAAFRNEVDAQIYKFRQDHDLKRKPHIHVGHTGLHEFQSLLKNFLESKQLKIGEDLTENSIERRKERLGKPTDHNVNYLRDKELANEWRDFHGKNANLKPQSAKENLTQKKQKVDMKPVIAPHLWK